MRIARATHGEKLAISESFMWRAHNGHARARGAAAQHEGQYCAQEHDLRGSASGRPTQFEEVTPMAFAAHFFSGSAAALPGNPAAAHPRPGLFSRVLATLMTM